MARRRRASRPGTAAPAASCSARRAARARTRRCRIRTLRLPDPEAALRPLHAGVRRRRVRLHASRSSSTSPRRCARTRAASARPRSPTRSAGRSTPSACRSSAPPRSSSSCSATSGRPGGGIIALRGHASIQGSTDIPTLYNTLPGYLSMPHVDDPRTLREWLDEYEAPAGWWGHLDAYLVSLLKAWWGAAATAKNEWCFDWLPRIDDDNSHYWTVQQMLEGKVKGYIVAGENPAIGSANGRAQRLGAREARLARRPRLRRDRDRGVLVRQPRGRVGRACAGGDPDGGVLHARGDAPREGRLVHQHAAAPAVALQGGRAARTTAARSCGSTTTSARKLRERLKDSNDPKDAPLQHLTWDYPTRRRGRRSRAPRRCSRRSRAATTTASRSAAYKLLQGRRIDVVRAAGSTAARSPSGVNQPARRKPHWEQSDDRARVGLGVAREPSHPLQPRLSRSRRQRRGRSARSSSGGTTRKRKWTGDDIPDFDEDKRAGLPAGGRTRRARRRSAATIRSSCRPTAAAGFTPRRA